VFPPAITKSTLPSALKSPVFTDLGELPTRKSICLVIPPRPSPKDTVTLLIFIFAVTKSTLPSLLKSPTLIASGDVFELKLI
jgi:hypothetical protein